MWYNYCSSQSNIAYILYSIVTLTCNHSFTQNKQAIYDKCFIVHWYYFVNISYSFKLLYCLNLASSVSLRSWAILESHSRIQYLVFKCIYLFSCLLNSKTRSRAKYIPLLQEK